VTPGARWFAPSLLLVLLAGCTPSGSTADAPAEVTPFADCTALTAAPSGAPAGSSAVGLPDVTLPCFTGGKPVRLADLRGPAVVNLWAVWCLPCRDELPAMQRLADRTAGRLHVVGVNTRDDRPAAASFAVDKGITIPTLYDRDERLRLALGRTGLPITVFVDGSGHTHVYNSVGLTDATLAELVAEHTGVTG
jgi:cytochrome c biogenesis protein CcmG/thiol:disulfide interchange protein DsbE